MSAWIANLIVRWVEWRERDKWDAVHSSFWVFK